jgi:hypothetical protein
MASLFEGDYGIAETKEDNTEITTMLLYFSKEEVLEFKKLCKAGMKKVYGEKVFENANITDFLITELRQKYGNS